MKRKDAEDQPVSIVLSGIGGYGFHYLKTLWEEVPPEQAELVGVADPDAKELEHYAELKKRKIRIYKELETFFNKGYTADLVVIASPIHLHATQCIVALANGANVLCEKPLGATVQDVDELIGVRDAAGKFVMVGYQWSYSDAIQNLKKDILNGVYGKPRLAMARCFWKRTAEYYSRNNWAGRLKDDKGNWVLDSPANNAAAHFLHNILFLLGPAMDRSADPVEVAAELYRFYPIENYDTCACRFLTRDNVECLFYASHAVKKEFRPLFQIKFDNGIVFNEPATGEVLGKLRGGRHLQYGVPDHDHQFKKLFEAIKAVREPGPVKCGVEAARAQTVVIDGMQESMSVCDFPDFMIDTNEETQERSVKNLYNILRDCYSFSKLPSELFYPWSRLGRPVNLRNYNHFPSRKLP